VCRPFVITSRALQRIAADMLGQVERKFGEKPTIQVDAMLKLVNDFTRQIMPYDEDGANKLSRPHYENNGLIGFSEYVQEGVGVCRH
jgi:hypothetical protein